MRSVSRRQGPRDWWRPRQLVRAAMRGIVAVLVLAAPASAATLSAGGSHTCEVRGGTVACWGLGDHGQLGRPIAMSATPLTVNGLVDAVAVSAGARHTCALREPGGKVSCWGDGALGQLGDGRHADSSDPRTVRGIRDAVDVVAGPGHTCAVLRTGTVWCWGDNTSWQLGNGSDASSDVPVRVRGIGNATSMAAGGYSCAVRASGRVACWGRQLAYRLVPYRTLRATPVAETLPGLSDVVEVAVGDAHACVLDRAGRVACWGDARSGQTGRFDSYSPLEPRYLYGLPPVDAITAGSRFTCAQERSGQTRCWGDGAGGALGIGSIDDTAAPKAVPGVTATGVVDAGSRHACASRTTGGTVCWGDGGYGRLGNGRTGFATAPVRPAGVGRASDIAIGEDFSCVTRPGLRAACWGSNGRDSGVFPYYYRPRDAVPLSGVWRAERAVVVATGINHACSVLDDGRVSCWGSSADGQLGEQRRADGGLLDPYRRAVAGIAHAVEVSAGHAFSCSVESDGATSCWGRGNEGQLGHGAAQSSDVPVGVRGLTDATAVASGDAHSCAIRKTGRVVCWGRNSSGQLGDGTTTSTTSPVAVPGIDQAVAITAGADHSCVLRSSGTVRCWGNGIDGQLGNGLTGAGASSSVPALVANLTDVTALAAGGHDTCVIVAAGVSCWGDGASGQLGGQPTADAAAPVAIPSLWPVAQVAVGSHHACARLADETLRCWGDGRRGQLADGQMPDGSYVRQLLPAPVLGP